MFGPRILLVQLDYILILFEDLAFPKGAVLLQRKEVLKHIIAVILHEADMRLVKVLAVILEDYVEDAIIIDGFILQEARFLFSGCDHRPKFVVGFAALARPFGVAPGVAQL